MDHFDTAVNSFQLKTALADAGRLRALEETALLHTLPDPEFDRLTRLATQLLAAPVSLVSLVAEDHQFFKSQQGLSEPWATERCTPLSHSFCQYLVASGEPLIVEDARLDPRLATNAAIEALKVVAYAGVPLRDRDGAVLGSLCAIDHRPRVWSSEQIASLTDLAAIAATTVERQRLGRQLQTRNAQLHTLADALPAAIYYCDADECFGFVNAAAARSLGGDSAALLGESQRTILGDVAYQAVAPHIEKALAGAPQCCQMTRQTPEGPRELEVHYVPQRGVAGAVVGFYVLELDIGDRLRLEEQRLRSSKLEMVGQMAGRVAHDFNNVLQVVRGNLELLSQAAGDADQREMIEDALSATHHGASLIQQLRAVSQYQSAQRQPLALADFLPKFARLARRLLSDEVTLVTELADPHLTLHADSHQLEAALLNLVTNARDALPSGGRIALAVTPHRQGGAGAEDRPGLTGGFYACLAVVDNGAGMTPEALTRATEPFFTTKGGQGAGLGLSSVQRFAQANDGLFVLESQPGQGTRALLFHPAVEAAPEENPGPTNSATAPVTRGRGEAILVVEDRHDVQLFITRTLHQFGYRPRAANDAEEALAFLDSGAAVDLVLSDIVMPGSMDGLGLEAWMTAHRPHIPLLLMTGYSEHVTEVPRRPLLLKPFGPLELAEAVSRTLALATS